MARWSVNLQWATQGSHTWSGTGLSLGVSHHRLNCLSSPWERWLLTYINVIVLNFVHWRISGRQCSTRYCCGHGLIKWLIWTELLYFLSGKKSNFCKSSLIYQCLKLYLEPYKYILGCHKFWSWAQHYFTSLSICKFLSPGLFIGKFQLSSGLLVVHACLGSAIFSMVRHSYGASAAWVSYYWHYQCARAFTHPEHLLAKGEDAGVVII